MRPYVCDCGRSYKYKQHLQYHQNHECGKEPAFACEFCPYKAKRRFTVVKHMEMKHQAHHLHARDFINDLLDKTLQSSKPYMCMKCGRSYKHNSTLWTHQKYECGKEPSFQCSFCPYRAKKKNNLKAHVVMKHADQFRAEIVG
ncbi:hypothetical protein J6590_014741 [Homalodisca vitripennis]|nr:hypothetical protein J6590_014741 [Homalodisca vitripennis]